MIPKDMRDYNPDQRFWMVDKRFFCNVFELAYEHFSKILLFEDNREETYYTGQFETNKKCRIRYENDTAFIDH
jgi:hypothetical protein